jgi:23S rRNA pseudouridine1911/1915/1917 synthase
LRLRIDEAQVGMRLDQALAAGVPGLSRARAQRLIAGGKLRRRDAEGLRRPVAKGAVVQLGDVLELEREDVAAARARPDPSTPLVVVYETDDVVIIDKPAGMPSAPRDGDELGCAANALVARYPEMADVGYAALEPGLCHRLDNDTSGLLLAARNQSAFEELATALRSGQLDKRYVLVCSDGPSLGDDGQIDWPIAPHAADARKMVACDPADHTPIRGTPRAAKTHYKVVRRSAGRALVEASAAAAGRHQIRIHFSKLSCSLVGDPVYGGEVVAGFDRHALHATQIRWSGGRVASFDVESVLPVDLLALCPVCDTPTST